LRLALARALDQTYRLESMLPHLSSINPYQVPTREVENDFVVFNEVVSVYRTKKLGAGDLNQFLQGIFISSEMHYVLRDYAAQHLIVLSESDPEYSSEILTAICRGLDDEHLQRTTIPGTIFNALNHLRQKSPETLEPFEEKLSQSLTQLLTQSYLATPAKVSLVQALKGQVQNDLAREGARTILRNLIKDPSTHEAVLISAAAVMGTIGSKDEIPLLEALVSRGTLATAAAEKSIQALTP